MLVKLTIQEDAELRAHVKDMIRGQVLSITREEIAKMVLEEISKNVAALISGRSSKLNQLVELAVNTQVSEGLRKNFYHGDPPLLMELASKVAANYINAERFEQLVYQSANAKIAELARRTTT